MDRAPEIVRAVQAAQGAAAAELSGTVLNILTSDPAEGVAVVLDPAVAGVDMVTDVDGNYSSLPGDIPDGMYTVTFQDDRFVEESVQIQIGPSAMRSGGSTAPANAPFSPGFLAGVKLHEFTHIDQFASGNWTDDPANRA